MANAKNNKMKAKPKLEPEKIKRIEKIGKTEKNEQEIHSAIKKMMILNKKAKIKIIAGIILAKRYIAKNKIKIKKYELKIKTNPGQAKIYRAKVDDLKAKNILLTKILSIFPALEAELNKEIGALTNEAGALYAKNFTFAKRAITRESNLLIKQKEILAALFKLLKSLRVKKPVLKKKEEKPAEKPPKLKQVKKK